MSALHSAPIALWQPMSGATARRVVRRPLGRIPTRAGLLPLIIFIPGARIATALILLIHPVNCMPDPSSG